MTDTGSADSIRPSMLIRLRDRDQLAWDEFVSVYSPLVYGWCLRRHVPPADAEELSQEVFRKVVMNLERFRRDRPGDSFRGWLWTITRNTVLDHFKREQPGGVGGTDWHDQMQSVADPDADDRLDFESQLPPPHVRRLYDRVMQVVQKSVSERRWKAFIGVVIDQRPAAEVAEELGMSRNAVYVARSTIMKRLRECLGEPDE